MDNESGTENPVPEKPSSAILPPKAEKNKKHETEATKCTSEVDPADPSTSSDKPGDTASSSITDTYQLSDDEKDEKLQEAIRMSCEENIPENQGKTELAEGATAWTETTKTKPDSAVLVNQIKGVLYGNCIGDAIGLLTEFMDKVEAQSRYGNGEDLEYGRKVKDRHRCNWAVGDWTDDSDQMILILRTLVQNNGKFDEKDFAKKLKHWVYHGYEELGDTGGCGLGRTTASVLSHRDFLHDPHRAARDVWEDSGRFIAPNGGVMRTSILGTMEFHDMDKVIQNTKNACMVTHADPRCVASCVAVTTAIALMLQGKFELNNGEQDVEEIMKIAHNFAEKEIKDPQHKEELKQHMFAESLDKLHLDAPRVIGYTFKCMGAGFWAFRQKDFRKAIQSITMEAGDADTNCAVAGALLGCKVGFKKLPKSWVDGLYNRKWLEKEIKSYFALLGFQY